MRLTKVITALVFGANLVAGGLIGRTTSGSDVEPASVIPTGPYGTIPVPDALSRRADGPDKTCGCIKKCSKRDYHVDPKNCARCLKCPRGKIADSKSGYKKCVSDRGQDDEEKRKRHDDKRKKWPQMKKLLTDKFNKGEPDRKKRQDERKQKRLGLCTVVAPLGMGWNFLKEVSDEFFDEGFLQGDDLLKLWPDDLKIKEWELDEWNDEDEEKFYKSDSFLGPWFKEIDKTAPSNIDIPDISKRVLEPDSAHNTLEARPVHKRFVQVLMGIIKGIVRAITGKIPKGKGGNYGKGDGAKAFDAFPEMKFGKGGKSAKKTSGEQSAKVKEMFDKGPMRACLERKGPTKS